MVEKFTFAPQIRWSDQDVQGHVNNARIVTLLEEGRINWLRRLRDREAIARPKLVAKQTIEYRKPVHYGPELTLEMTITHIGNSSFTIGSQGFQDGELCLDSEVVLVTLDEGTMRPAPMSAGDKEYLRRFLRDPA